MFCGVCESILEEGMEKGAVVRSIGSGPLPCAHALVRARLGMTGSLPLKALCSALHEGHRRRVTVAFLEGAGKVGSNDPPSPPRRPSCQPPPPPPARGQ